MTYKNILINFKKLNNTNKNKIIKLYILKINQMINKMNQ